MIKTIRPFLFIVLRALASMGFSHYCYAVARLCALPFINMWFTWLHALSIINTRLRTLPVMNMRLTCLFVFSSTFNWLQKKSKLWNRTITNREPSLWENLPSEYKLAASIEEFKVKIKKFDTCPCRLCKKYQQNLGFVN